MNVPCHAQTILEISHVCCRMSSGVPYNCQNGCSAGSEKLRRETRTCCGGCSEGRTTTSGVSRDAVSSGSGDTTVTRAAAEPPTSSALAPPRPCRGCSSWPAHTNVRRHLNRIQVLSTSVLLRFRPPLPGSGCHARAAGAANGLHVSIQGCHCKCHGTSS